MRIAQWLVLYSVPSILMEFELIDNPQLFDLFYVIFEEKFVRFKKGTLKYT